MPPAIFQCQPAKITGNIDFNKFQFHPANQSCLAVMYFSHEFDRQLFLSLWSDHVQIYKFHDCNIPFSHEFQNDQAGNGGHEQ